MPFAFRAFTLAKDPQQPGEYQDAWRCAPEAGVAAVADGVASAIFSGPWAEVLVEAIIAQPLSLDQHDGLGTWLAARRAQWQAKIDTTGLAWFQKAKLPAGAFSTLLWVTIAADNAEATWLCRAIGDSCLFHVRDGRLLCVFPIERTEDFAADPVVLGSVNLNRDHLLEFKSAQGSCCPGDLLVLATDAVAQWILSEVEAGNPPTWNDFWTMTEMEWRDGLDRLRTEGAMRYDDATLVVLRIDGGTPATPEANDAGAVALVDVELTIPVLVADDPCQVELVTPEPVAETPAVPMIQDTAPVPPVVLPDESLTEKLKKTSEEVARGLEDAAEQVSTGLGKLTERFKRFYRNYIRPDKPKE